MISFNTVLISAVAVFASQVEAKNIHNSCLKLSDDLEGYEGGEFTTNEAQLTEFGMDDQFRLHSFTTCMNDSEEVTGMQLFLAVNPYNTDDAQVHSLAPIGQMVGTCETVKPSEGLEKIRAADGNNDAGI